MTDSAERYIHFSCCLEWLNECWSLLQTLKGEPSNPLRGPAFRFALVLYGKPYRESRGTSIRKHRLDNSFVPVELQSLHSEVLNQRDQLHAHSDLTVMDALLTVHRFEEKQYALMIRNHIDQTALLSRLDEIISLVEATLDRMYAEAKKLEAGLRAAEA